MAVAKVLVALNVGMILFVNLFTREGSALASGVLIVSKREAAS